MSRLWVALGLVLTLPLSASALPGPGDGESDDRVLAPYFQVLGDDATGVLPLKETRADVQISGVIASVRITQVYHNTGSQPIEAIYVFPGSTQAAVFGMEMTIGKRTIKAKIDKKEQARKLYEDAKRAGKSASLLEQQRPNVFQMNVANIMPGDEIKVELDYTELMVPEDGFYEFVYPAVVGPRYSTKTAADSPPSEAWVSNPYLKKGSPAPYKWDIGVELSAGLGIQKLSSPSHQITPKFTSKNEATVSLGGTDTFIKHDTKNPGNRDFVLKYRLTGGAITSGMLMFPGTDENFFLVMLQPPTRVKKQAIPAREYVFIVDVSGSMGGFPMQVSKALMKDLLNDLRPEDSFNVMMFAGGSHVLSPKSLPATRANIANGVSFVDGQRGGGSTQLLPALDRALNLPTNDNVSRTFVVITDGYVNVEKETFKKIHDNLGRANMFAFGIGSSVNRHIIEGMAHVGMGEPFVVLNQAQAGPVAKKFREYISSPVLTNINVEFARGFQAYDVEPKNVPDLFAERPMLLFGKYKGEPTGRVSVTGVTGEGDFSTHLRVGEYKPSSNNKALRHLWARHRVRNLADMNPTMTKDNIEEVTNLGLKYSFMTAYTSFVAIDSEVRNANGDLVTVKQPLPLPAGVENSAVGAPMGRRVAYKRGKGKKVRQAYNAPAPATRSMDRESSGGDSSSDDFALDGTAAEELTILGAREPKDEKNRADKPRHATRVMIRSVKTNGGLTKAEVSAALNKLKPRLISCNQPRGKLTLTLTIDATGKITNIQEVSNRSRINVGCFRSLIRSLTLSNTGKSTTATVVLSFK